MELLSMYTDESCGTTNMLSMWITGSKTKSLNIICQSLEKGCGLGRKKIEG